MASSPPPGNMAALQQLAHAVQEQLQQQNQQQAQQIGEMHQQLLAMQQEIHSLHANPAAALPRADVAASDRSRGHGELLRAAKRPECFRGEHGMYALNWLQEMDIFLENCESPPSESQKITLAKSFLRDEALRWWCAREKNVQRALASGDASLVALTPAINTWNDFQKEVSEYFCPRGASDEARNELHRLRQNQFRSLEAYADRFEAISRRIEVPVGQSIEEELIATFKAGLMDGLIRLSLTNARPRTLFQAIQQAHQAESDLRVSGARTSLGRQDYSRRSFDARAPMHRFSGNHLGRFRASGETSFNHPPHGHPNRMSGASVPMDLSAMADFEERVNNSDCDSDQSRSGERGHRDSRLSDDDVRSPSPVGSIPDQSPLNSPDSADATGHSSCQLNAAQMRQTSVSSRCQQCGQQTQRRPQVSRSSDCWNCGQAGHLRRDCPKPPRNTKANVISNRQSGHKPHHF